MPEIVLLLLGAVVAVILLWVTGAFFGMSGDEIYKAGFLVGGFAGLVLAAKRTKAAQDASRTSAEGQITDRFTKAIEQLGSDKLSVRIGGLYALKRIAEDSERDAKPILDVVENIIDEIVSSGEWKSVEQDNISNFTNKNEFNTCLSDIKFLTMSGLFVFYLTVKKEIKEKYESKYGDFVVDISMSGIELRSIKWSGVTFDGLYVNFCKIIWADLSRARFIKTWMAIDSVSGDLVDSSFQDSEFDGVIFSKSKVIRAHYVGCKFKNTKFYECDLSQSRFERCFFEGVQFILCNLSSVEVYACDGTDSIEFRQGGFFPKDPSWTYRDCFPVGLPDNKMEQIEIRDWRDQENSWALIAYIWRFFFRTEKRRKRKY